MGYCFRSCHNLCPDLCINIVLWKNRTDYYTIANIITKIIIYICENNYNKKLNYCTLSFSLIGEF